MYSMSDLAFLLLIFIMLVSLIHYRVQVPIQHAQAERAAGVNAEKNLEIWIDRSGSFFLEGQASTLTEIELRADFTRQSAPETQVHIIADRDTPFETVYQALELLQILEYPRVSFVVKAEARL